jgi:PadR family transcriptional regulator, regulatory protein PadR
MWWRSMARTPVTSPLGEFEQITLLALLRLEPDAYGAAIRREIETRAGRAVLLGAVYTTLDRMERKGLVSSWIGDPTPERGGRRKKFYRLEPAGAAALDASLRAVRQLVAGVERRLSSRLGGAR